MIMKNIVVLILSFFALSSVAQNGLYLTLEDYKNKKLTDERTHSFRSNDVIRMYNKGDKSSEYVVDYSKVWGIRRGYTDFRIINGKPCAILVAGKYYYYGGITNQFSKDKKTGEFTFVVNSSTPYISIGIEGVPVQNKSYPDLYKQLGVTDIKAFKKEFVKWKPNHEGGYPPELVDFANFKANNSIKQPRFTDEIIEE